MHAALLDPHFLVMATPPTGRTALAGEAGGPHAINLATPGGAGPAAPPEGDDRADSDDGGPQDGEVGAGAEADVAADAARPVRIDPGVSSLFVSVDAELCPVILSAYAESRGLAALTRPMVKALSAPPMIDGGERRKILGSRDPESLAAVLLEKELAPIDPALELEGGPYDRDRLTSTLVELVEVCAHPAAVSPASVTTSGGGIMDANSLATLGTAIGAATAGAISSSGAGKDSEARAAVKMDAQAYNKLIADYESQNDEEIAGSEVANRTIAKFLYDSLVTGRAWPRDASVAVDKMAPLDNGDGESLTSDLPIWTFDPATGTSKSGATDPVAADAVDQAAFLSKLSILLTTSAVVCAKTLVDDGDYKCSGGREKLWLSRAAAKAFHKAAEGGMGMPLRALRVVVSKALGEVRDSVNRGVPGPGGRQDTLCPGAALRLAAPGLKASIGSATVAAMTVAAYVDAELESARATSGAGTPGRDGREEPRIPRGKPEKPPKKRSSPEAAEKSKKTRLDAEKRRTERKNEEFTDAGGRVWKAARGGNDDCPVACTNRSHQKGTWCAKSHKEIP